VNKRGIGWLLAVLMTLSASQAVPVVRTNAASGAIAIVWIARPRARAERQLPLRLLPVYRPLRAAVRQAVEQFLSSRLPFESLYQRPPPFALA